MSDFFGRQVRSAAYFCLGIWSKRQFTIRLKESAASLPFELNNLDRRRADINAEHALRITAAK